MWLQESDKDRRDGEQRKQELETRPEPEPGPGPRTEPMVEDVQEVFVIHPFDLLRV